MPFRCPSCGGDVRTRVLADPVTIIVVGHCEDHGVQEVSRVYIGEVSEAATATSDTVSEDAADAAPALSVVRERISDPAGATAPVAYKPGTCCGRRLADHSWCHLPVDHDEPHAA